jgi:hypothetical protein
MKTNLRRLAAALTLTAAVTTIGITATDALSVPQDDTGWGAPAGDTGWGSHHTPHGHSLGLASKRAVWCGRMGKPPPPDSTHPGPSVRLACNTVFTALSRIPRRGRAVVRRRQTTVGPHRIGWGPTVLYNPGHSSSPESSSSSA